MQTRLLKEFAHWDARTSYAHFFCQQVKAYTLKEKPPAFQLYVKDFLEGSAHMSNAETGAYIKLLCHQWLRLGLPDDTAILTRFCGGDQAGIEAVLPKFKKAKNGLLKNNRLEMERKKQNNYKKNCEKRAKKGAYNRWKDKGLDASSIDEALLKNGSSSSSSSSIKEIYKEKDGELVGLEVTNSIEYCDRTFQRKYSISEIQNLWKGFLINGINQYYPNRHEKVKHFRNWIKLQPYKQNQETNYFSGPPLKIENG